MSGTTAQTSATYIVKRVMRLPTAHRFVLAARLARDPRVPRRARWSLAALVAYLAMPLDIIPDFIPVIGQLDDVLVAGIAVWWFLRTCPAEVAIEEIERLERLPIGPAAARLPGALALAGLLVLAAAVVWLAGV